MKQAWFKRCGWVYRPVSWQGGALALVSLGFCGQVFIAIDRHTHSVRDTLYGIFPYFACAFLLLNWVAVHSTED